MENTTDCTLEESSFVPEKLDLARRDAAERTYAYVDICLIDPNAEPQILFLSLGDPPLEKRESFTPRLSSSMCSFPRDRQDRRKVESS